MSNEEYMRARSRKGGRVQCCLRLKACKKRSKKATMRTEASEMLDVNALHNINDEKITIPKDSGAAVSAMPKDMHPNVPKCGGPRPPSI